MLAGFVRSVRYLLEPPVEREVLVPCPCCDAYYQQDDSEQDTGRAALIGPLTVTGTPVVTHHDCGASWTTIGALLTLGYHAHAVMDTETLAAMGLAPTPNIASGVE